eukprot:TRINITY_DN6574_c0_g4_i1.p1 TRINITY_DN6574_c0_g4~~TRINITY_DN6574_c0_g4_i1.p1  ORF type:complete len:868 (-),score=91.66 TRINITY_DN6574_c0_g4_i1:745-3348(-)
MLEKGAIALLPAAGSRPKRKTEELNIQDDQSYSKRLKTAWPAFKIKDQQTGEWKPVIPKPTPVFDKLRSQASAPALKRKFPASYYRTPTSSKFRRRIMALSRSDDLLDDDPEIKQAYKKDSTVNATQPEGLPTSSSLPEIKFQPLQTKLSTIPESPSSQLKQQPSPDFTPSTPTSSVVGIALPKQFQFTQEGKTNTDDKQKNIVNNTENVPNGLKTPTGNLPENVKVTSPIWNLGLQSTSAGSPYQVSTSATENGLVLNKLKGASSQDNNHQNIAKSEVKDSVPYFTFKIQKQQDSAAVGNVGISQKQNTTTTNNNSQQLSLELTPKFSFGVQKEPLNLGKDQKVGAMDGNTQQQIVQVSSPQFAFGPKPSDTNNSQLPTQNSPAQNISQNVATPSDLNTTSTRGPQAAVEATSSVPKFSFGKVQNDQKDDKNNNNATSSAQAFTFGLGSNSNNQQAVSSSVTFPQIGQSQPSTAISSGFTLQLSQPALTNNSSQSANVNKDKESFQPFSFGFGSSSNSLDTSKNPTLQAFSFGFSSNGTNSFPQFGQSSASTFTSGGFNLQLSQPSLINTSQQSLVIGSSQQPSTAFQSSPIISTPNSFQFGVSQNQIGIQQPGNNSAQFVSTGTTQFTLSGQQNNEVALQQQQSQFGNKSQPFFFSQGSSSQQQSQQYNQFTSQSQPFFFSQGVQSSPQFFAQNSQFLQSQNNSADPFKQNNIVNLFGSNSLSQPVLQVSSPGSSILFGQQQQVSPVSNFGNSQQQTGMTQAGSFFNLGPQGSQGFQSTAAFGSSQQQSQGNQGFQNPVVFGNSQQSQGNSGFNLSQNNPFASQGNNPIGSISQNSNVGGFSLGSQSQELSSQSGRRKLRAKRRG